MKKFGIIFTVAILVTMLLTGCQCKHEWVDATCETPKTCAKCGQVEGEALKHKWTNATCTESQHCSLCGKVQGEELGHDWTEATCTSGKKCKRCGVMGGEALEHKPGQWEMIEIDPVTANAKFCQKCKNCGVKLGEEERQSKILYNNDEFIFTPAELSQRLANLVVTNQLSFETGYTNPQYTEEPFARYILNDGEKIAMLFPSDALGDMIISGQQNKTGISKIVMVMSNIDFEIFKQECKLLMITCDPSFDSFESLNTAFESFWNTVAEGKLYRRNGLTYELIVGKDDTFLLTVGPST